MITLRTIEDVVSRRIGPLLARLNNAVTRGTLTTMATGDGEPDAATGLQRGQVATVADQVADDIEFVNIYGLSGRPAAGAEALVLSIGGAASHLLGLLFDRRIRLKSTLADGEVALHIGLAGQVVHLKRNGSIEVRAANAAGGSIVLTSNGHVVVTPGPGGMVYLGQAGAAKKVALADDVDARLATIAAMHDAHVHPGVVVGPGSTAVTTMLVGPLAPTGAELVRGK